MSAPRRCSKSPSTSIRPLSLKKKYVRRFAKVLAPARVARFFQIERKLDAVQNLSIVEQIPLIAPIGRTRPIV